jgi:hypothetical protein
MDFLDPKKKRAHKIRLYIGYFLMAIALGIGTLILLFESFGYDVNHKTGTVIQNGLVFVDAHPAAAQIYVNGKQEGQTDARLTLPAGQYSFELKRDGYRTWKRDFELEGSVIERLSYAFLFPEKLEPKDVQLYASQPTFATQSPDRKWLMTLQPGSLTKFDVMDLSNQANPVTAITLPDTLLNAAAGDHKLETIEWSNDNRHVLIKHTYQGGDEFIMIDREDPNQSFSVNKTFNIALSQVALRDKKYDQLHLLEGNGGVLRFGDVKTKNLALLASRVKSFKSYSDDVLLYMTEEGAPQDKILLNIRRGTNDYKIREFPKGAVYLTDITKFDDHWYTAAGVDTDHKVYVYKDVFDDVARDSPRPAPPVAVLRLQKLEYLSVSANTRFIGVQGGSEFATYDVEHDRQYRYDTKLTLAPDQKATWMDGHRWTINSEGQMVVVDFDGSNLQKLVPATSGFLPFFDRDYDNLYVMGPSATVKDKPAITKSPVRIPSDQ